MAIRVFSPDEAEKLLKSKKETLNSADMTVIHDRNNIFVKNKEVQAQKLSH